MKLFLVVFIFVYLTTARAVEHRHEEAHVHGAGKISIAFDGLNGRIEFEAAAESILGFEYRAKSARDKAILTNALSSFKKDFNSMVQFDQNRGCVISADQVDQSFENKKSTHSNFKATYNVICKSLLADSTIRFDFSAFEHLNDIDVNIVVDELQKNIEISDKKSSVQLK